MLTINPIILRTNPGIIPLNIPIIPNKKTAGIRIVTKKLMIKLETKKIKETLLYILATIGIKIIFAAIPSFIWLII